MARSRKPNFKPYRSKTWYCVFCQEVVNYHRRCALCEILLHDDPQACTCKSNHGEPVAWKGLEICVSCMIYYIQTGYYILNRRGRFVRADKKKEKPCPQRSG